MIRGYYRLGRPINALAGCLAVVLSGYVAGAQSWWPLIMATATVLFITVSTNAWNDYLDIEIDRINKPGRPLPSGQVSPRGALIFAFAGTALSLGLAAFINQPAFFITLASNIILYLYSWKLKCTILLGNIAVAAIIALCFIFGGVAAGNTRPVLFLALIVFFAILGREILKTMADYRGDLQNNCMTIATAWGNKTAGLFVAAALGLTALIMPALFFIEQYGAVYLYIVFIVIYPLFLYTAYTATRGSSFMVLERSSLLMKYGFFVWFLAVALGAAGAA